MIFNIFYIPIITGLTILIFGRSLGPKGIFTIIVNNYTIAILSLLLATKEYINGLINEIKLFQWIEAGYLKGGLIFRIETSQVFLIYLILFAGFFIILYSFWYLSHDPHLNKFLAYLSLFI